MHINRAVEEFNTNQSAKIRLPMAKTSPETAP
jgi:hypothetical protein